MMNRADSRLLADLKGVGIDVHTVWDLVNTRTRYAPAIPVLQAFLNADLSRPEPDRDLRNVEGVVRALSVPEAKPGAQQVLLRQFVRESNTASLRWAIGNALNVLADQGALSEIIALVANQRWGYARQMLVLWLVDYPQPRVIETLEELLGESELVLHAANVLGAIGVSSSLARLESSLDQPSAMRRRAIEKAIRRIEKRTQVG